MDAQSVTFFSNRLDALRELRGGISKNELNERCGFADGSISRISTRRSAPRSETTEIIAAALGVNFDYLTRGVGPRDVVGIPEHWGFSRMHVAMRVLAAQGLYNPEQIERAANAVTESLALRAPDLLEALGGMTVKSWIGDIVDALLVPPKALPTTSQALNPENTRWIFPPDVILYLLGADRSERGRKLVGFSDSVRKAVLGVVFTYEVPLEVALKEAADLVAADPAADDASKGVIYWYSLLVPRVAGQRGSGTFPALEKTIQAKS